MCAFPKNLCIFLHIFEFIGIELLVFYDYVCRICSNIPSFLLYICNFCLFLSPVRDSSVVLIIFSEIQLLIPLTFLCIVVLSFFFVLIIISFLLLPLHFFLSLFKLSLYTRWDLNLQPQDQGRVMLGMLY